MKQNNTTELLRNIFHKIAIQMTQQLHKSPNYFCPLFALFLSVVGRLLKDIRSRSCRKTIKETSHLWKGIAIELSDPPTSRHTHTDKPRCDIAPSPKFVVPDPVKASANANNFQNIPHRGLRKGFC